MSGADKNRKNDLSRDQSACGDVLKMTGAMPGKKGHKMADLCPFYVRTGLKINVQVQKVTRTNNVQRAIFSSLS